MLKKLNHLALATLVAVSTVAVPAMAQTGPTLPDATAQLEAVATSVGTYSTVMFAIAIAAVGIMIGVKWIKRGKSAA